MLEVDGVVSISWKIGVPVLSEVWRSIPTVIVTVEPEAEAVTTGFLAPYADKSN
jgi:hypothetical protein